MEYPPTVKTSHIMSVTLTLRSEPLCGGRTNREEGSTQNRGSTAGLFPDSSAVGDRSPWVKPSATGMWPEGGPGGPTHPNVLGVLCLSRQL